jgi:inosose dehydratase
LSHSHSSRRAFILNAATLAIGLSKPSRALAAVLEPPLYPPVDLSRFDLPVTPAPAEIRLGCAAITWGGNDVQAIKDIADIGFRGIQLRSNVLPQFGARPAALRDLLKEHNLELVAFSSGGVRTDPAVTKDEIKLHMDHARFVRDLEGYYLQLTDSARPTDRAPVAGDYRRLGQLLTEISRRVVDMGVKVGYHNHMGSLGESPKDVDRILNEADPRYVKLELDVAHYQQGGGDPAQAISRYRDRILFLHLKDVESLKPTSDSRRSYRFVELGRGRVDLKAVVAALKKINFRGWAIVELDSVPDSSRTPKESALISKKYVEEELGLKL